MRALTITDTNVLKGIAILLLLCHHCFYPGEPYDDIVLFGHPIVQNIGEFSKLCVAIFVFFSGYGLTIQAMAQGGIKNVWAFYRRRYVKLMINYWLIWFIFVPMGVFIFHRTFPLVYGEHFMLRAFWDFLGLHQAVFNEAGYNATWWFYSCIIVLYLIYPILWRFREFWFIMIPSAICIPTATDFVPFLGPSCYGLYFLCFVCGISFAYKKPCLDVNGGGKLLLAALFLLACLYRFYAWSYYMWDTAIVTIGITLYSTVSLPNVISRLLVFLGKHSFNIFLFHTFIFNYYFHDYIYWSTNPVIIFLTLLAACTTISCILEIFKRFLKIEKLLKTVGGR